MFRDKVNSTMFLQICLILEDLFLVKKEHFFNKKMKKRFSYEIGFLKK